MTKSKIDHYLACSLRQPGFNSSLLFGWSAQIFRALKRQIVSSFPWWNFRFPIENIIRNKLKSKFSGPVTDDSDCQMNRPTITRNINSQIVNGLENWKMRASESQSFLLTLAWFSSLNPITSRTCIATQIQIKSSLPNEIHFCLTQFETISGQKEKLWRNILETNSLH